MSPTICFICGALALVAALVEVVALVRHRPQPGATPPGPWQLPHNRTIYAGFAVQNLSFALLAFGFGLTGVWHLWSLCAFVPAVLVGVALICVGVLIGRRARPAPESAR